MADATPHAQVKQTLLALLKAGAGSVVFATAAVVAQPAQADAPADTRPLADRVEEVRKELPMPEAGITNPEGLGAPLAWHNWGNHWNNWHNGWHNWGNWHNWHNF